MLMTKGANTAVPTGALRVDMGWRSGPGVPGVDASALLLVNGKVRSDADFVFYNQPAHASGAIRHEGKREDDGRVTDSLFVDLSGLEPAIDTVILAASSDGGSFGQVPGLRVEVRDAARGTVTARFDNPGATVETAFVLGEFYRRQGAWKFRAVGQGYGSGLAGLATDYGITVDQPQPQPQPQSQSQSQSQPPPPAAAPVPEAPPARPVALTKVTLTKAAPVVSLAKQGGTSGALRVNLNWQTRTRTPSTGGWAQRLGRSLAPRGTLDLDLCALYELTDGSKGVVQSLGNAFGALDRPPFIHLDGDDRTGAVTSGENLTVNLDHRRHLSRVLVFVTVYEGARSFADLHATVTLQPQHGAPVDFSLDECTVPSTVCALALLTADGDDLLVRREARYLVPEPGVSPQRTVDRAYGWGMDWTPGRK